MPTLDELPVELLAHVALFTNKVDNRYDIDVRELLALRCASRCCRDAVRRAARQHEAVEVLSFQGSSAQKIAVVGRVFGIGCRGLTIEAVRSDECAIALRDFVMSTNGQLRKLVCYGGSTVHPNFITVPKPVLLEMCCACPLLEKLYLFSVPDSITANLDDFASVVGSACPLLESVWIPCSLSPAEGYQWYFPRLQCLTFNGRESASGPIRWDKIELTLRTCVHATEVELNDETVSPRLVDLILAAPVASRLKTLDLSNTTVISPELILRFARGLEMLTNLRLPDYFNGESAFYRSLVQARPAIVRLDLGFANSLDNEDLRFICHRLRLEHLDLSFNDISLAASHPNAIDVIVESPCAQTLRSINLCQLPFITEELLQLLRGCPKLAKLEWEAPEEDEYEYLILSPIEDGPEVDAINALLKSRGGEAIAFFDEYGPRVRPPVL